MDKLQVDKGERLFFRLMDLMENFDENKMISILENEDERDLIVELLSLDKYKKKKQKMIAKVDAYVEGILTNSSFEFFLNTLSVATSTIISVLLGIYIEETSGEGIGIWIAVIAAIGLFVILQVLAKFLDRLRKDKGKINTCMFYLLLLSKSLKDLGD